MSEGNAQAESTIQAAPAEQVRVNEQQQQRIQAYLRAYRFRAVVAALLFLAVETFILFVITSPGVGALLAPPWLMFQPLSGWYPLLILVGYLLFFVVESVPVFLINLAVGYLLRRRYKMRAIPFLEWLSGQLRLAGRLLVSGLFLTECFFLLFVIQPQLWWLWLALVLSLLSTTRSYLAPWYAFRRLSRLKRTPLTDEKLVDMLNQLCVRHKTSIRHFFLLESRKPGKLLLPNGYITGWGRTSSILLSSGLLKAFPYAEIRSVIAHELGHHIHRTTLKKQLLKSGLLLAELFLYAVLYHWLQELLLNHSLQELLLGPFTSGDVELPVVLFIVILALSMRLGCFFVRQAYSRRHEYLADEFALRATLDVPAFKNSMLRLGNMNNIPLILSPSQERSRTHPAKISRLRHADEFAARQARDAPAGGWY